MARNRLSLSAPALGRRLELFRLDGLAVERGASRVRIVRPTARRPNACRKMNDTLLQESGFARPSLAPYSLSRETSQ